MLPLRWKGTDKEPIPPEWRYVVARPSMVSGRNRYATHPVNAMLNYTYAVLESQVRIATVSQGLDPAIGYLHVCRPGRVALVYDLMEPLRPQVDRLVLHFVRSQTFSPSDFTLGIDGVCRLHPELTKHMAQLTMSDILVQEVVVGVVKKLRMAAAHAKNTH
jgi:CRISPR-associated protein Cas1